jgi:hypothetical protein
VNNRSSNPTPHQGDPPRVRFFAIDPVDVSSVTLTPLSARRKIIRLEVDAVIEALILAAAATDVLVDPALPLGPRCHTSTASFPAGTSPRHAFDCDSRVISVESGQTGVRTFTGR